MSASIISLSFLIFFFFLITIALSIFVILILTKEIIRIINRQDKIIINTFFTTIISIIMITQKEKFINNYKKNSMSYFSDLNDLDLS